eukprot:CAMPEP_0204877210 /NCGR_PEP_ID=MMETSP1348-20121228/48070_1 /ASSEMBLY_ACC=CAM_ASM_000700 /TAXON_ID=215587 /ORGANISM="Aplanochytrium stocchinoi, Strain GSBS06" /LENGTH=564 /DNA_ID=CAMNT_0052034059 /DNA_START=87 /DNA_END=1778 /DNA_ORIENTATION=+
MVFFTANSLVVLFIFLSIVSLQGVVSKSPWCDLAASNSDVHATAIKHIQVSNSSLFEQVHVSLQRYENSSASGGSGCWSAWISWALADPSVSSYYNNQEDLNAAFGKAVNDIDGSVASMVPAVLVSRNRDSLISNGRENINEDDSCVALFHGEQRQYKHVRDDRDSGQFANGEKNRFYLSPRLFHAHIANLPPSTKFFYRVGKVLLNNPSYSVNGTFRDTVFHFVTPPKTGEDMKSFESKPMMKLVVIGDIGQTLFSEHTRDSILTEMDDMDDVPPTLAMIVGDLSYADGAQDRWDIFGRKMEPLFSRLPLMVLPGNHEIELDMETHETFKAYRNRFIMPGNYSINNSIPATNIDPHNWQEYSVKLRYDGGASYYSVDVGLCHLIVLNTYDTNSEMVETVDKNGLRRIISLQQKFLEDDLVKVDRKVTPFLIVFMHGPFYNSNEAHHNEVATKSMKEWVEPILYRHKVDVVFAGHVHAYERNYGVKFERASVNSTIFITVGDGGNHELLYPHWLYPTPTYSAYRSGKHYGHGELEIFNKTHIRWVWKPNGEDLTDEPATLDSAW